MDSWLDYKITCYWRWKLLKIRDKKGQEEQLAKKYGSVLHDLFFDFHLLPVFKKGASSFQTGRLLNNHPF